MILIFGGGDIAEKGIIPTVGGRVTPANVPDLHEVRAAIKIYEPDVVINCAGVSHVSIVADSDPDRWEDELAVNLLGSYYVAKAAVDAGVGTLIFIASVAGLYGKPNHSGYSASKAGVISLVQSLGMEGHNAYAISPGRVDTRMRERDFPGENPRTRLTPTQVGEVVADILAGKYEPGDNIVIRKEGLETVHLGADKGEPWRTVLRVGLPPTC